MKKRILIVDDEADLEDLIRQKFKKKISSGELYFDFAHNGVEAIKKIQSEENYNLVFTDINMPEMDGLRFLKEIESSNPLFKTVVVSAYGDMDNIRTAMNRGAYDFLTKPIDFNDFETTLNKGANEYQKIFEGIEAKQKLVEEQIARFKAEESERFKQRFLANMSHEIRTPLNAIKGLTYMLLKGGKLNSEQESNLEIIKKSTDNLIKIINDILDLSKIQAGKLELENIDFALTEILKNTQDLLQFMANEKNISLIVDYDNEIPEALLGDPVRLGQVFLNLASNAVKFTEKGSVTISAKLLNQKNNKSLIRFAVTDTGIGMTAEQVKKIFESFSQASSDTFRKYGGTGLGLDISKSLVEMMGGKLEVESTYGEGTTFSFCLEMKRGDSLKLIVLQEDLEYPVVKDISILLFEDNLFNQIAATQILNSTIENLTLEIAENGKIGYEMLMKKEFDIVLMDIQMPEMDGYETTLKIRNEIDKAKKNIPIIAMTANATKEEIQKCLQSGMDDFITKPFEPADLIMKINHLLNHKNI